MLLGHPSLHRRELCRHHYGASFESHISLGSDSSAATISKIPKLCFSQTRFLLGMVDDDEPSEIEKSQWTADGTTTSGIERTNERVNGLMLSKLQISPWWAVIDLQGNLPTNNFSRWEKALRLISERHNSESPDFLLQQSTGNTNTLQACLLKIIELKSYCSTELIPLIFYCGSLAKNRP